MTRDYAIDTRHANWCADLYRDYVKPVLIFLFGIGIGIIVCGVAG
jgi:hypothetical protein